MQQTANAINKKKANTCQKGRLTMAQKKILLTASDLERLEQILSVFMEQSTGKESPRIQQLAYTLEDAQVVNPEDMPHDVVTMHSKVVLEAANDGNRLEYTLVYPSQSNAYEGKISVLSAMGVALLGSRIGEEIVWEGPHGTRSYQLVAIPEQGILAGQHT